MKFFLLYVHVIVILSCQNATNKPVTDTINTKNDSPVSRKEASNRFAPIDISPVDISYYPPDYPVIKMSNKDTAGPIARVIYSRPHRQGRKILGVLLKYDSVWRLGANEATEIEFFQPVNILNKKVNRGRYILYAIPRQKNWTVILNNNIYSWGLKPDPKKDVYKFDIPVHNSDITLEYFTMIFQKTPTGADLVMTWEDINARLPISF